MSRYDPPVRRRLYRSRRSRRLFGVCGGLADYFGIDPIIPRIVFLLLFFGGGSGGLIYLVMWLVLEDNPYQ